MVKPDPSTVDVLTHVDFEGPGAIADVAESRGITVRLHHLWDGAAVPAPDTIERLVVMGGPMGALDDVTHPYLTPERTLLAELTARFTPVLGVCLGAQLLAAALGATVERGPVPEIGAGQVTPTLAASDDPLFATCPATDLSVFHWHGDTFGLPDHAVLLASSSAYTHQAFRVANAYGFQFHIELRASDTPVVQAQLGPRHWVTADELAAIEPVGRRIIEAFFDLKRPA